MSAEQKISYLSRRDVLKLADGLTRSMAGSMVGYEFFANLGSLERARDITYPVVRIPVNNLPEKWWLVHLTDIHVKDGLGINTVNPDTCTEIANSLSMELNNIEADPARTILALTGDGVIGDSDNLTPLEIYIQSMQRFDTIPALWRFSVPGNHDINYMHQDAGDIRRVNRKLGYEVMGWEDKDRLVINTTHLPFQIAGTPDYTLSPEWYSNPPDSFFSELKMQKPTLWLTHNASVFDICGWGNYLNDNFYNVTALCGHTHGAQIDNKAPSVMQHIGGNLALSMIDYKSEYITGTYECGNNVRIHVCNGVGSGTPIRTADRQVGILELVPN